jgi:rubredoxin
MSACPQCSGEPWLLGELGRLMWYRCRQCGWQWSHRSLRRPKPSSGNRQHLRISDLSSDATSL